MLELPPLNEQTFWAILNDEIEDAIANALVWVCLGYAYNEQTQVWSSEAVAPEWLEHYPEPPDFIASRPATVKLTRSIPKDDKHLLKNQLGFKGYSVDELVPRKTRRATMVSWLLSYVRQHQAQS
ncbi:MAG: DUF1823 family protein [Cyanobacteria bacterium P01_H01_bin.121]